MRNFLICVFCFFAGAVTINGKPAAALSQQAIVTFPEVGAVQIRAITKLKQPMRLEFYSLRTKKIIATITPNDAPMVSPVTEIMRFKIIQTKQLSAPLIFLTTVSMGGSDGTFWGQLIGWRNNTFAVLNEEKFETAVQGGFYVGELDQKLGFGVAVWEFIWCVEEENSTQQANCNESHYSKHRYKLALFPFDVTTLTFKPAHEMTTKKKYDTGEHALREFGFRFTDLRKMDARLRECLE